MRILFASDDDDDIRVGAVKSIHRLAERLGTLGHHCQMLWRQDVGRWPARERWRLALSPWLVRRAVMRAWRQLGPFDVIDVAGADGSALTLLRHLSCYRDARIIVRSHGADALWFETLVQDDRAGYASKPWYRRLLFPLTRLLPERLAWHLADAVIVANPRECATLGHGMRDRVHVIPHGVLQRRWAEAPPADAPRGRGILFSGYWQPVKGIWNLAEAYRQLVAAGAPIPLTLLSATEDLDTEREAILSAFSPECRPLITVLMRTDNMDEVFALYRTHDLLVCPSNFEGFGLVVVEAMSQRLPVVCTDAVGAIHHLSPEDGVVVVPARDAGALARALTLLCADPEQRRRRAEAAYRCAQNLTWMRAAQATLAVYQGEPGQATFLPPDVTVTASASL